ncbi:MAG: hypothetical protein H6659_02990 [Ardenticatenaceae bacterium]|nr:hypothetical protein [Ardenticatenaceae bacterium]MCB8986850.1 hypothetical protein [Ardenticatenaceae bacterium]
MSRRWWVIGAVALVMALFVGWSAAQGGPGFPLDDGWIHQTYARSLARNGRWEYTPGVVSAGSTAPLWTMLLALGYVLHLPYLLWAFVLGGLSLLWLAWAGMQLWRLLWPDFADRDWLAGLTLVLTWPLVWSAASGMETILFAALGLQIAALYGRTAVQDESPDWKAVAVLGFLSGLLILTRPDGMVLVLLVGVGLLLLPGSWRQRVLAGVVFAALTAVPLLPYFAFNLSASGSIWPNTFYAKQAEYQALLATPLPVRFISLLYFSWGGPAAGWRGISSAHLLLLPGVIAAGWQALTADWRSRLLVRTLPLWWAGGHVLLYAWRLPVTYQHGRYLFAALPVWVLYGLAGWLWLLGRLGNGRQARILKQAAGLTFGLLLLLFLLLGAQSYAADVAFIEGEMVDAAHWLAANTPPDALIAAHDIGAIGYFAERPLLDLAGLVSPEIISLLTDEGSLAAYVRASGARYLVTAPGWEYLNLTTDPEVQLVYSTDFAWTEAQGVNGTAVFKLP